MRPIKKRYIDGVALSDNLYSDPKGRQGYYRYKQEIGKFKTFHGPGPVRQKSAQPLYHGRRPPPLNVFWSERPDLNRRPPHPQCLGYRLQPVDSKHIQQKHKNPNSRQI